MEISQLKKSVSDMAKTLGAMVEEKLGERSHVEEQVRNLAKQVEKVVADTVWKTGLSSHSAKNVTIRFKKLDHFRGDTPAYATSGSSGMDVRAATEEAVELEPGQRSLIPTGLSVEIPHGFEIQVRPRSGLAISKGISLVNTPGTIDADYRGEVKVIVINLGQEKVTIQPQERIAQLVVCPIVQATVEWSDDLSQTERGAGGFGSTGV